jgi:hypothetical protein
MLSSNPLMARLPSDFTGLRIGQPVYNHTVALGTYLSMLALKGEAHRRGVEISLGVTSNSRIAHSRNVIVSGFLHDQLSHLLFVDADIEFDPADVFRLIAADKEVIAGVAQLKPPGLEFPVEWPQNAGNGLNVCQSTGAIEVDAVGTGFMMIKRSALLRLMGEFPDLKYDKPKSDATTEYLFNLFSFEMRDGVYLSEDFNFCRLWRSVGGQVWIMPQIRLRHCGMHGFDARVSDLLAPVAISLP